MYQLRQTVDSRLISLHTSSCDKIEISFLRKKLHSNCKLPHRFQLLRFPCKFFIELLKTAKVVFIICILEQICKYLPVCIVIADQYQQLGKVPYIKMHIKNT